MSAISRAFKHPNGSIILDFGIRGERAMQYHLSPTGGFQAQGMAVVNDFSDLEEMAWDGEIQNMLEMGQIMTRINRPLNENDFDHLINLTSEMVQDFEGPST